MAICSKVPDWITAPASSTTTRCANARASTMSWVTRMVTPGNRARYVRRSRPAHSGGCRHRARRRARRGAGGGARWPGRGPGPPAAPAHPRSTWAWPGPARRVRPARARRGPLPGGGLVHPLRSRTERHVLEQAEVGEEQVVLEHHPDWASLGGNAAAGPRVVDLLPSISTYPWSNGRRPARARSTVLLPAPLGPRRATTSPASARSRHLEIEGAQPHPQIRVQDHDDPPIQRSRSHTMTTSDTTTRTRLRAMARSGCSSSAR